LGDVLQNHPTRYLIVKDLNRLPGALSFVFPQREKKALVSFGLGVNYFFTLFHFGPIRPPEVILSDRPQGGRLLYAPYPGVNPRGLNCPDFFPGHQGYLNQYLKKTRQSLSALSPAFPGCVMVEAFMRRSHMFGALPLELSIVHIG
jgi:hypothetical protein